MVHARPPKNLSTLSQQAYAASWTLLLCSTKIAVMQQCCQTQNELRSQAPNWEEGPPATHMHVVHCQALIVCRGTQARGAAGQRRGSQASGKSRGRSTCLKPPQQLLVCVTDNAAARSAALRCTSRGCSHLQLAWLLASSPPDSLQAACVLLMTHMTPATASTWHTVPLLPLCP